MLKYSVLIVDDNIHWSNVLKTELEKNSSFKVHPPLHNGKDALDFIVTYTPDILLLDMLIPVFDGLYIVNYIHSKIKDYDPFIYVLSGIGVDKTAQFMQNLQVDYYSVKPIDSHAVLENLLKLAVANKNSAQKIGSQRNAAKNKLQAVSLNLDELIDDFLYELGLVLYKTSTQCTHEVLVICLNDESSIGRLTDVYDRVAAQGGKSNTRGSVERNIRSVISTIKKMNNSYTAQCFPEGMGKLTNSMFISNSVYILKKRIEDIINR